MSKLHLLQAKLTKLRNVGMLEKSKVAEEALGLALDVLTDLYERLNDLERR